MAMITCPECGRRISDKSPACMGCGIQMEEIRVILRKRLITCPVCGSDYRASWYCCPNCNYPSLCLSNKPDKYSEQIRLYKSALHKKTDLLSESEPYAVPEDRDDSPDNTGDNLKGTLLGQKKKTSIIICYVLILLLIVIGIIGIITTVKGASQRRTDTNKSKNTPTAEEKNKEENTPDEDSADELEDSNPNKKRAVAYFNSKLLGDIKFDPDLYNSKARDYYQSMVDYCRNKLDQNSKGNPIYINSYDTALIYHQFAIDDFDGDGLLEIAVLFSLKNEPERRYINLYYYDNIYQNVDENSFDGFERLGVAQSYYYEEKFKLEKVKFYDNMIWIEKDEENNSKYTLLYQFSWLSNTAYNLKYIDNGSDSITVIKKMLGMKDFDSWELSRTAFEESLRKQIDGANQIYPEFHAF